MKITGWLFAGILLVLLLYVQLCTHKDTKAQTQIEQEFNKRIQDTAAYYEEIARADSAAVELAVAKAEESFNARREAEDSLYATETIIAGLRGKLKNARQEIPNAGPHGYDEKWMSVSPRYINACDSLDVITGKQSTIIKSLNIKNTQLAGNLKTAKSKYEESISNAGAFNAALKKQLDTCQIKLSEAGPPARTQFYVGANLFGNKQTLISGGQITGTLLTKKNTMFEVNGLLINGKMYAGIGTKVLISFRKK